MSTTLHNKAHSDIPMIVYQSSTRKLPLAQAYTGAILTYVPLSLGNGTLSVMPCSIWVHCINLILRLQADRMDVISLDVVALDMSVFVFVNKINHII